MKCASIFAQVFVILILGLESTSGLLLASYKSSVEQKQEIEKMLNNHNKSAPVCPDKDGNYNCPP